MGFCGTLQQVWHFGMFPSECQELCKWSEECRLEQVNSAQDL